MIQAALNAALDEGKRCTESKVPEWVNLNCVILPILYADIYRWQQPIWHLWVVELHLHRIFQSQGRHRSLVIKCVFVSINHKEVEERRLIPIVIMDKIFES